MVDGRPQTLGRNAQRKMRRNGREDVATVKGVGYPLAPVSPLAHFNQYVWQPSTSYERKQAIIGRKIPLTFDLGINDASRRAHAGIHNRHMDRTSGEPPA